MGSKDPEQGLRKFRWINVGHNWLPDNFLPHILVVDTKVMALLDKAPWVKMLVDIHRTMGTVDRNQHNHQAEILRRALNKGPGNHTVLIVALWRLKRVLLIIELKHEKITNQMFLSRIIIIESILLAAVIM